MTGPADWGQISFIVAAILGSVMLVLAGAWFLWQRIAEVRSKCFTEINAVSKELSDFKLKVAENYVKRDVLSEVDIRIGRAIADMRKDFGDRLDDMKDMLMAPSSGQRSGTEPWRR